MKELAPDARTAVETIFQLKIDPLRFTLAESDNKQEVKQLSLNF